MRDLRLPAARRRWSRTDPVLHRISKESPPPRRQLEPRAPFEALVMSIAHQQVSIAAGAAIFARIAQACAGSVTPAAILAAGPERLRAAGLSRSKTAYALDLAQRSSSGSLDLDRLPAMEDDDVIAQLTQVKGIGVWTAKMFLIFHLDRPDVLPHEDLGLQIAVARAYRVPREKAAARMQELRPAWSPYASLAALTLWHWRHVDEKARTDEA